MSHLRYHIADILVTLFTLAGQIAIARIFLERRKKLHPALARTLGVILALLWIPFLFTIPDRFSNRFHFIGRVPHTLRTVLVATGNIWGMSALVSLAIYLLFAFFVPKHAAFYSPDRRRLIHAAGTVAVAAPFAAAAFGAIVERTNFQVKEVDFPVPNLHPDFEGFRVGQLSDLHVSPWLSPRDARRAVDMLNETKPHLTLVTGDLITQRGDPLDAAIREIGRLRADAGVLGCLGNHERYADCEDYETMEVARHGIRMLRGESQVVRWGHGRLNIAGVDYESRREGPYLRNAEQLIVPGMANVLLSHNPDVFPTAAGKGFDAVISGHTHGGQVTVEYLNQTLNLARFATPFVAGLYRLQGRSCYVTAGIGTIALPVRIGAPPEITVLRLKRA